MLSKPVLEALKDIFAQVPSNDGHSEVTEDPEAYLLGLLMQIQEDLHSDAKYRAILFNAIEQGSYEDQFNDAKKALGRPTKQVAKRSSKRRAKRAA